MHVDVKQNNVLLTTGHCEREANIDLTHVINQCTWFVWIIGIFNVGE